MTYLIVNADDFGLTRGTTRGILDAHHNGVVTSTSLMVATPWSEDAASLAANEPRLSVGLHADLTNDATGHALDLGDTNASLAELERQLRLFESLLGRPPTHLDSHHNSHRDPRLLPSFERVARERAIPLREHSPARYVSSFYGQWNGETHLEQISVTTFLALLDSHDDDVLELSCHPGYRDRDLQSAYSAEREIEIATLCDPALRRGLDERGITLIGFGDLSRLEPAVAGARS